MDTTMDRLSELRSRTPAMLEHLRAMVEAESPTNDLEQTARCAAVIGELGAGLVGAAPERVVADGRTHLLWRFGADTRVLLIGHLDTVWPAGTIGRWPFAIDGDRATGPGAFDMKAGIVQGLHALSTVPDLDGVTALFTSDEEIGSPSSTSLIEELAASAGAALILEPSAGGALKTGRKGVSIYSIEIAGHATHAGLEPEKGSNALVELAHQVLALEAMADAPVGTTVTPSLAHAGTAVNVVPARATIEVDVRVLTLAEQERVERAVKTLTPRVPGTSIRVSGEPNRPPLEEAQSADLFARASKLAAELGVGALRGITVGGASDGNLTAARGCPTLDGLGAVGDGAHAEGEYVDITEMPARACLVAALVEELLRDGRR
jgi:glutamate carboxypeptidase